LSRVLAPEPAAIEEAALALRRGRLVAFPTETVYGLGGIATDAEAVARIYRAKGRPAHNPLIVHVADLAAAEALVTMDERALAVATAFWPGPLTLVLPRRAGCPIAANATAGHATLAVRVPAQPVACALLRATGLPLAAPSANPSGLVSPTTAQHVAADLGDAVDIVLDGGPCPVGVESTVLDLAGPRPRILRPGGLDRVVIELLTGPLAAGSGDEAAPRSPGQLASHYAPRLPVRLDATNVMPGEALLAFGPEPLEGAVAMRNLSPTGDPAEAARNLFAMLRELDRSGACGIAVMPIPAEGLGEAVRDRLRRAAAPRP
jgi:L-threonylcarbamoyladenylate synthase